MSSASMPLCAVDFQGRSVRATIDLVTLKNVGERIVLTFMNGDEPCVPVVLMPMDAKALGKALEMFA